MAKGPAKKVSKKAANPKTTRPAAISRRPQLDTKPMGSLAGRKLDAFPDRLDSRDWFYQPTLAPLPSVLVNTVRAVP